MRSIGTTSKISSTGPGLDRVLSSNFIVIKIRMIVPRKVAGLPIAHTISGAPLDDNEPVPLERRILFSLN